jgi:hypothetical protein
MAVLDGRNEWPDGELIGRPCFFCGLHAGCVLELFVRLARDVHEVEHRTRRHVTVERWRCDLIGEEFR